MDPDLGPSWGSFWAPIWPPGMLKPISSVASGRPRAVPYNIFSAQDRPSTSQDASRTAPSAPKVPPRLSKSLQDGSVSLQELSRRGFLRAQAVSKSSLEELPKPPAFALPPLASGLQVASAGSAKRKFAVPSGVLDSQLLILLTSYLLRI